MAGKSPRLGVVSVVAMVYVTILHHYLHSSGDSFCDDINSSTACLCATLTPTPTGTTSIFNCHYSTLLLRMYFKSDFLGS